MAETNVVTLPAPGGPDLRADERANAEARDRLAQALSRARPWRDRPGGARLLARRRDYRGHSLRRHRRAARAHPGLERLADDGPARGQEPRDQAGARALGLSVNRLIRISFGPFELADLAEGEVVEARTRVLRDQLGPRAGARGGRRFRRADRERAEPEPPPRRRPKPVGRRPPRSPPAALRAAPAGASRTRRGRAARRAAARTAALGRAGAQAQARRRAQSRERRRGGGAAQADRAFGDQRPQGPRRRRRARAADREEERRRELARRKAEARREGRVPRAGKSFQARDRAEGGERPLRRSSGGFGEERGGGETTSREDRAPRSPRAGKPYEPRNRAEGGERPPRRPAARFSEGRSAEGGGGEAAPHERQAVPTAQSRRGRRTSAAPTRRAFQPKGAAPSAAAGMRRRAKTGRRAPASLIEPRNRSRRSGPARPRRGAATSAAPARARRRRARRRTRSGEPPPREDHKPRKPRLNKPFAKRPFGGKGHGGPRKGRPGGKRPPRRP